MASVYSWILSSDMPIWAAIAWAMAATMSSRVMEPRVWETMASSSSLEGRLMILV